MKLDVLIFDSHPDDSELGMGGTISKMTSSGIKVGIINLSQGELGTRGDSRTRSLESSRSSEILKLTLRENLSYPDGQLRSNNKYVLGVVSRIRKYNPEIIFAPYFNDRHPDHIGTSQMVKEAMFFSGLEKIKTFDENGEQKSYRPRKLFYFMQTYVFDPAFVVDVSGHFGTKMEAVRAYATQFYNPDSKSDEPETFISQPRFLDYIDARGKFYGFQIGKEYGEPFYCEEKIELDIINYLGVSTD